VAAPAGRSAETASRTCLLARQQELLRVYDRAVALYLHCVQQDPLQTDAMTRLAELHYRRMQYAEARGWAERALGVDTYDPAANFILGVSLRALGRPAAAREALGWAARAEAYRSAAYTELAEILLSAGRFDDAADYARRALDASRANVPALAALAMAARWLGRGSEADEARREILRIDPLSHVARAEAWRASPSRGTEQALTSAIRSELPHESWLELASVYARAGLHGDAAAVLRLAPTHPLVDYWLAYLLRGAAPVPAESDAALDRATQASPRLVFPFRPETLHVLEWALSKRRDWTTLYYAGLIYWSHGRLDEAAALFAECGDRPDFAAFYLTRAELARRLGREPGLQDVTRAHQLAPDDWRSWVALARAQSVLPDMPDAALTTIRAAAEKFPASFIVGLEYARHLVDARLYDDALAVLDRIVVLPYENASEGRQLYERAHLMLAGQRIRDGRYEDALAHVAQSREWPERLGVGRPYTPDERLQDLLEAHAARRLGRQAAAPSADAVARLRADLQRSGSWRLELLNLLQP
jgi:tetratricopeptide (TPR) repeat protein